MTSVPQILGRLSSWVSTSGKTLRGIFACGHARLDPLTLGMPEAKIQPYQNRAMGPATRFQMPAHNARPLQPLWPEPDPDPLMRIPVGGLRVGVRYRTQADGELAIGHPRRLGSWQRTAPSGASTPSQARHAGEPIEWLTPAVDPLVAADGHLILVAMRVREEAGLKVQPGELTALGRMAPLLPAAKIRRSPVTRAEGYLQRLSA